MKHFKKTANDLVELTDAEIDSLKTAGRYYFSPVNIEGEQAHVQWPDEEIDKRKAEELAPPPLKPFQDRIREAFASLPVPLQKKYKDEIRDAAFFLERGNLPMVLEFIKDAEAKLQPEETAVKAIIDAAKLELGGG